MITTLNLNNNYLSNTLTTKINNINIAHNTNLSNSITIFKTTHNTAPKYTNQNKINPNSIELSDNNVQTYYNEHANKFMNPKQMILKYVQLNKNNFFNQIEVNNEDLKPLYKNEITNLTKQHQTTHILIKNDDETTRNKIKKIKKHVNTNKNFATLTKKFSQNPNSTIENNDLNYTNPNIYNPTFENKLS